MVEKRFDALLLCPGRGAKYCDRRVCLSVYPLAYLTNHVYKHHLILCALYPWPWFSTPLTTTQYVT